MSLDLSCDECRGAFCTGDEQICRNCFDRIVEEKGGLDLRVEDLELQIVDLDEKVKELEEQIAGLGFSPD